MGVIKYRFGFNYSVIYITSDFSPPYFIYIIVYES